MNLLVSACILGVKCRYNETGERNDALYALTKEGKHHLIRSVRKCWGVFPHPEANAKS
jgi:uncharacterized protein YbbK (DUF523 family)